MLLVLPACGVDIRYYRLQQQSTMKPTCLVHFRTLCSGRYTGAARHTAHAQLEKRARRNYVASSKCYRRTVDVYSWTRALRSPTLYLAHLLLDLSGVHAPHSMFREGSGGGGPVVGVVDIILACCTVRVLSAVGMGKRAN